MFEHDSSENDLNEIESYPNESGTIIQEDSISTKETVETVLARWSDSWSSQDIDAYLKTYAENFVPSKEISRGKWEKQRRNRVTSPSFIKVTLANTEIKSRGPNHVNVEFSHDSCVS